MFTAVYDRKQKNEWALNSSISWMNDTEKWVRNRKQKQKQPITKEAEKLIKKIIVETELNFSKNTFRGFVKLTNLFPYEMET